MDLFQALVLGLVQGLTEFLPISSSAHLIIVPWLFGWKGAAITSLPFDVALHMGTLVAVLVYFAPDWKRLLVALFGSLKSRGTSGDPDARLVWYIVAASIPAALTGVLLESKLDELFHEQSNVRTGIFIIGAVMVFMGGLLLVAERVGSHVLSLSDLRLRTALFVGLAQAMAVIPGVSRSGSTITAGLFLGLKRESAARFSFLLATPVVLGAGLYSLLKLVRGTGIPADEYLGFGLGFVAAAISGYVCVAFLMRYLQKNSTAPFIWYRLMLGALLILLALFGGA